MKVLIVIDMQVGTTQGSYHKQYLNKKWWKRYDETVSNIQTLVAKADRVIFVALTCFRKKSYFKIIKELKPFLKDHEFISKRYDDGSDEVAAIVSKKDKMFVCGMNTNACVIRTVRGLKKQGFKITIIGDACWTVYGAKSPKSHNDILSNARRLKNIDVIKTKDFFSKVRNKAD